MPDVILDGSYLEGGGQILRNALALSALTGKSFSVSDIRKGRCNPGLKAQHLYCVKAAAQLCGADFTDVEIGSETVAFFPKKLKAQNLDIDIGTAGSMSLFLQAVLLPAMFANAPLKISVAGGTDVIWSMPVDYLKNVFLPHLQKYARAEIRILKRGFYPKGGGKIEIEIRPKFKSNDFENFEEFAGYLKQKGRIVLEEQGKLLQVKGVSHASKNLWDAKVAERQAMSAESALKKLKCPVQIASEYSDTYSPGSAVTLWAIFSKGEEIDSLNPIILGADALGERGKSSENVGKEAAEKLLKEIESGAPVDQHLADNLIPFLGLFGGKIRVSRITNHTLTNIYVTEKFLDVKFKVDKEKNIIECS